MVLNSTGKGRGSREISGICTQHPARDCGLVGGKGSSGEGAGVLPSSGGAGSPVWMTGAGQLRLSSGMAPHPKGTVLPRRVGLQTSLKPARCKLHASDSCLLESTEKVPRVRPWLKATRFQLCSARVVKMSGFIFHLADRSLFSLQHSHRRSQEGTGKLSNVLRGERGEWRCLNSVRWSHLPSLLLSVDCMAPSVKPW